MGDPSAERQIANVYFTECDTVEGSFAVNGIGPRRFVCLTINFDDMHRILSIFSIKAVYLTNIKAYGDVSGLTLLANPA
jgi:hypothetical protein